MASHADMKTSLTSRCEPAPTSLISCTSSSGQKNFYRKFTSMCVRVYDVCVCVRKRVCVCVHVVRAW